MDLMDKLNLHFVLDFDYCKDFVMCTLHWSQVNRIRELPQNSKIVATHTDSPDVSSAFSGHSAWKIKLLLLFSIHFFKRSSSFSHASLIYLFSGSHLGHWGSTRPACCAWSSTFSSGFGMHLWKFSLCCPTELLFFYCIIWASFYLQILTGHQDTAEFALAMCRTEPFVLSGGLYWCYLCVLSCGLQVSHQRFLRAGKDKSVVLWSIQDHITTASADSKSPGSSIKQAGEVSNKTGGDSIGPRGVYHGHEDTVEDVAFCPSK